MGSDVCVYVRMFHLPNGLRGLYGIQQRKIILRVISQISFQPVCLSTVTRKILESSLWTKKIWYSELNLSRCVPVIYMRSNLAELTGHLNRVQRAYDDMMSNANLTDYLLERALAVPNRCRGRASTSTKCQATEVVTVDSFNRGKLCTYKVRTPNIGPHFKSVPSNYRFCFTE
jgi:hypothetical protein